jgi:2-amino-4-hydroxy-6-hydroxymethyldihydropteridine diphosphokinase
MPVCLISLGSNLGNRRENLEAAAARLAVHPQIRLLARSMWRETAPVGGPTGQDRFLNGAIRIETSLAPHELLACLQQTEAELGRQRIERWGPRTIDLDLLLYGDLVINTPTLVVPHPRMAWRRFVLEPAAEVGESLIHPTIGWSVARLLVHLNDSAPYIAITGPIAAGKTRLAERLADAIPAKMLPEQPDWSQLDAFYADPTAHAWEMELEFIEERIKKVSGTVLQPAASWVVSDFWFDQSAAFARAWLPAERIAEYLAKYEPSRRAVAAPRLVVLLDAPADELRARVGRRGRHCERHLTVEALERIRQEVIAEVKRPGVGPVLWADDDPEAAFAEVLAAVRGME